MTGTGMLADSEGGAGDVIAPLVGGPRAGESWAVLVRLGRGEEIGDVSSGGGGVDIVVGSWIEESDAAGRDRRRDLKCRARLRLSLVDH